MNKKNLCVLLLGLFVSFSEIQETKAVKIKYVGCIKGSPFKHVYQNERKNIKWAEICDSKTCNFTSTVQECAKGAAAKGYHAFAVHFYGECREATLDHYEEGETCIGKGGGISNAGDAKSSAVYKIDTSCSNGHKDEARWDIPKTPLECQKCRCHKGEEKCSLIYCDFNFPCEKYLKSNKCCTGECACHHNGVDKMEGQEWTNRNNDGRGGCRECRCQGGKSICTPRLIVCNTNCPKPEYIPGKCCPRCLPKAPTTRPWETLPSTRPPPTFPPWLFGKRISRKRFEWSSLKQ